MKTRRIKIVEIIADSELGGGPEHVLGLLRNLDKDLFECFLICPPGHLVNEARKIGRIDLKTLTISSKFDIKAIFKLRKIIEEIRSKDDPFGPIIVHAHGPRAGLIVRFLKIAGVRYVYTEHIHSSGYHLKNRCNEWLQKRLLKYLNGKTDLIVAVSESVRDFLINSGLAPKDRVLVIPNAVNFDKFKHYKHEPSSKTPVIGAVGNLYKTKGQEYLIKALPAILKRFPLLSLEIIGEGPERKNLEALIQKLDLNRHITLLGRRSDVLKHMSQWSLVVLPSLVEPFGIVILEAFALGVPIVASRVGGIPEIIEDGKQGLLVQPGDEDAISEAVIEILENERRADKMAEQGAKRARDFDWENIVKNYEKLYSGLGGL
jgi:glycosyltransferase involved in cell wall biosynthesis